MFVCRHEDGTVRFWDASGVCLHPMYKLSTAGVFHTDTDPNDNMNQSTEGEWPLFRKVRQSSSQQQLLAVQHPNVESTKPLGSETITNFRLVESV